MNDVRAAFHAYPKSKFPLRMLMFSPAGELQFDTGEITGFSAIEVPGLGPGSVRYTITLFGDGDAEFNDDPSCGGTVDYTSNDMDVLGRLMHFIEIVQSAGRSFIEDGSLVTNKLDNPELKQFFETQVQIGELFLEGAEETRKMLEASASKEET